MAMMGVDSAAGPSPSRFASRGGLNKRIGVECSGWDVSKQVHKLCPSMSFHRAIFSTKKRVPPGHHLPDVKGSIMNLHKSGSFEVLEAWKTSGGAFGIRFAACLSGSSETGSGGCEQDTRLLRHDEAVNTKTVCSSFYQFEGAVPR
jgi:hypothetical protein